MGKGNEIKMPGDTMHLDHHVYGNREFKDRATYSDLGKGLCLYYELVFTHIISPWSVPREVSTFSLQFRHLWNSV